jgi:hypothetical protein
MLPVHQVTTAGPAVKISSGRTTNGNGGGNGSDPISGRGLAHRKLSYPERVSLAADVADHVKWFDPSLSQLASIFRVDVAALRAERKARTTAANENDRETLSAMAVELVARLGLDGALDLLVEVDS